MIVLKKKEKIYEFFFDLPAYIAFKQKNDTSKYTVKYFKGLGSWKKDELKQLIDKHGLDRFIETLTMDSNASTIIHNWLSFSTASERKKYIKGCPFNLFNT